MSRYIAQRIGATTAADLPRRRTKPHPRPPRPDYNQAVRTVEIVKGKQRVRTNTLREAKRQQGRSRGGLTAWAKGKAHRWTSEEASKVARRQWKKRQKRTGRVAGRRLARAARTTAAMKADIRRYYSETDHTTKGIWYDKDSGQWYRDRGDNLPHVISERHALRTLGYIRMKTKQIPQDMVPIPRGRKPAGTGE